MARSKYGRMRTRTIGKKKPAKTTVRRSRFGVGSLLSYWIDGVRDVLVRSSKHPRRMATHGTRRRPYSRSKSWWLKPGKRRLL